MCVCERAQLMQNECAALMLKVFSAHCIEHTGKMAATIGRLLGTSVSFIQQ